jgi:hypothetical protein
MFCGICDVTSMREIKLLLVSLIFLTAQLCRHYYLFVLKKTKQSQGQGSVAEFVAVRLVVFL